MDESLFTTRQLTEYRNWMGEQGCLFYMHDYSCDNLYEQGAIFIVNTPCRVDDKVGDCDFLHQSEKQILKTTTPVITGFAALLIIQDFSLTQDKYNTADELWDNYFKEILKIHPNWKNEADLVMQECKNSISCDRNVLTLYLGSESNFKRYLDCLKHAIHTVLLRNTRTVIDTIKMFQPIIRIPDTKDYIRYEVEKNELVLHQLDSSKVCTHKTISGWTAIQINYVAVRQIVRDFSCTTHFDRAIQYLIACLDSSPANALALDKLHIPLFNTDRADELFPLAHKIYDDYKRNYLKTNIHFTSLPPEQKKQEILYMMFLNEVEQRNNLDIIKDMTDEDKLTLNNYHYAFFSKIQYMLPQHSKFYTEVMNFCSNNFNSEEPITPITCEFIIDANKTEEILEKIRKYTKGKSNPRDIMMPIRAAIDAGVINRPTFVQLQQVFRDFCPKSKSSVSNYTNPDIQPYFGEAYRIMIEDFKSIK